jgi:hypothetical protein
MFYSYIVLLLKPLKQLLETQCQYFYLFVFISTADRLGICQLKKI